MKIRFSYSIQFNYGVQHHDREIDIDVPGDSGEYGEPTYSQLWEAENEFRAAFRSLHPQDHLLMYTAIPGDGSQGRFSDYRAFLPAPTEKSESEPYREPRASATVEKIGHLTGGYRFQVSSDQSMLRIWPFSNDGGVQIQLNNEKKFFEILKKSGFDIVGFEERVFEGNQSSLALWHVAPNIAVDIGVDRIPHSYWAALGTAAKKQGRESVHECCHSIAFSIAAMQHHVLNLSNEYFRELEQSLRRNREPGERFSSVDTFGLWLSVHSFLVAAGSVRDYLAKLLSLTLFQEYIPEKHREKTDSMAALLKQNKKNSFLKDSEIGDHLLKITEPEHGWLAMLSELRNIVVHRAPITAIANRGHLEMARTAMFADKPVDQIVFALPVNPFNKDQNETCDALVMMRRFNELVVDLSFRVGSIIELEPEIETITESDIVSVKKL